MGTDMKQMYLDLNELLQDICQFLSGDKLTNLSPRDQKLVESLINRSKVQLQEISKIQINQNNEEYMVMDSKDDDFNKKIEVTIVDEKIYPYEDLPARDASKDVKSGDIFMKRKFLIGFEKMKRVYGSIHEGWLLIYFTHRDTKPICTFNLRNYEAKKCDGDKMDFNLIGTIPGKKTHNFEALTQKDMKQWVTQINKFHDHAMMNDLDSRYSIKYEGTSDDETDIYETLTTDPESEKLPNKSPFKGKPPFLPGRTSVNTKAKKPIKVPPPVIKTDVVNHSSEEDLGSYHEIEILEKSSSRSLSNSTKSFEDSRNDSFSEESLYERFVSVQEKVRNLRNGTETGQLEAENNALAANMVVSSSFASMGKNCSSYSPTNPTPLTTKKSPPALPSRRPSTLNRHQASEELLSNSCSDDSDDDSTYDRLCPVKSDIVDTKTTKTSPEHKGRPPVSAKPKLANKPSGWKLSILTTSVKTVKH